MMEPPLSELDAGFEPQQRARSNTWPLPRPDNFVDIKEEPGIKCPGGVVLPCGGVMGPEGPLPGGLQLPAAAKKNSSRRNAWGNLSYADLITQAIQSAPEKRLTLSQIYEWMVQNVPYFKDKGDSNSSAGWKNSIRHNLSLHNRFMRVQNEGTGKSSWWMINPDAKPGKSARRRATSMETSKFEKRRGRVKKKVEALRNGLQAATDATPSPSSSISEGLDMFPGSPSVATASFQLSPDFRPRASSNASSCGRMSPFHSVPVDTEWASYSTASGFGPEQLAGNLAEGMKLHQGGEFMQSYGGGNGGSNGQQPPPPPPPYDFGTPQQLHAASPYGLSQCPLHRMQACSCHLQHSPSYAQSEPSPDPLRGQPVPQGAQFGPPRALSSRDTDSRPDTPAPSTMMGQLMGALNNNALLDDLNLNIETLQGGFDCNVEEVIKHELSMDGSLDFNFSQNHHHAGIHQSAPGAQELQQGIGPQQPPVSYSTTVSTGPSWVH